jgi:hypothetical protein
VRKQTPECFSLTRCFTHRTLRDSCRTIFGHKGSCWGLQVETMKPQGVWWQRTQCAARLACGARAEGDGVTRVQLRLDADTEAVHIPVRARVSASCAASCVRPIPNPCHRSLLPILGCQSKSPSPRCISGPVIRTAADGVGAVQHAPVKKCRIEWIFP